MNKLYKIEVYVPEAHLDKLKESIFDAGAGKIGSYDCCCWEVQGTGQFRPLESSDPFLGRVGELEQVREIKVETVCSEKSISSVLDAINKSHPYETPAYQYWLVNDNIGSKSNKFTYAGNINTGKREEADGL